MTVPEIFAQLQASAKVTMDFPTEDDFQRMYAQLRHQKSREAIRWQALFNEDFFDGKVIRFARSNEFPLRVTFSLDARAKRGKTSFTIVSVSDPLAEAIKLEPQDVAPFHTNTTNSSESL